MLFNSWAFLFFLFNDPATSQIYTLSLHDALPILPDRYPLAPGAGWRAAVSRGRRGGSVSGRPRARSEEHTSELQSPVHLVCRLLLEKKKISTSTSPCFGPSSSNSTISSDFFAPKD